MSHEILLTYAARGLKPGSRGFCTVAATASASMSLTEKLESLSGYRHAFTAAGDEASLNPTNYAHAIVRVDREEFHVLSRVANAGTDAEGRPSRIAHHVALERSELTPAGPAAALASPGFCERSWHGDPRLLPQGRIPPKEDIPAHFCEEWEKLTGDAGWAGVLAECALAPNKKPVCLIFEPGTKVLPLIAEAISLLPPNRRWEVTFSTYVANLRAEIDYDWKCHLVGTPEAAQAHTNPRVRVIDLSQLLGRAEGGELVELARNAPALATFNQPKRSSAPSKETVPEPAVTSDSPKPKKPSVPLPPMDEPVELADIQPVELDEAVAKEPARPKPRAIPSPKTREIPPPAEAGGKRTSSATPTSTKATSKGKANRLPYFVGGSVLACLVVVGVLFGSGMFGGGDSLPEEEDTAVAQVESSTDDLASLDNSPSGSSSTTSSSDSGTENMTSQSNSGVNISTKTTDDTTVPEKSPDTGTAKSKVPETSTTKSSTEVARVDTKKADDKSGPPATNPDAKTNSTPDTGTTAKSSNPPENEPIPERPKRTWLLAGLPAALRFFDMGESDPLETRLRNDDRIRTLPEFRVDVALSPHLTMRVLDESLVEFMAPWEAETNSVPVVRVIYGRLMLSGDGTQAVHLHLRAGEAGSDNGTLTITPRESPESGVRPLVGIEVARNRSKPDEVQLAIYSTAPSATQWDGTAVVQGEFPAAWESAPSVEVSEAAIKLIEFQREVAALKELPPYTAEYRTALVDLLSKEVESPGLEDQALAARCLASLGEFEHLGRLIAMLDMPNGRKLQNDWQLLAGTMQVAATRNPENAEKVFDALKTRHVYSEARNELAMLRDLIGGISPEQLDITRAAAMNVPEKNLAKGMDYCLRSNKVVLRVFAIWNLRHLADDFFGYDPCDAPNSRTNERALAKLSKELGLVQ